MSHASIYSPHPSLAREHAFLANIPEKTGKTLDQWTRLIEESGPRTTSERRNWLMKTYGLTRDYTRTIVEFAEGRGGAENYNPDAFVEAMYAGPKADLRPLNDTLVRLGLSMGGDVKICPCKTIVPMYRRHVFAEIKPSTRTRIDLGLALGTSSEPLPRRLVETGGVARGDRITHRIPLTSADEIDAELKQFLRMAYDLDT